WWTTPSIRGGTHAVASTRTASSTRRRRRRSGGAGRGTYRSPSRPTPSPPPPAPAPPRRREAKHDFPAFRGADARETPRSTVRRVLASAMHDEPPLLVYRVEATAFLKHMVRNGVGTLVEVGSGVRAPQSVAEVLAGRDRTRAGATAPPHGLTLVEVRY